MKSINQADKGAKNSAINRDWRSRKSAAFDLYSNSTTKQAVQTNIFGKAVTVYGNANLAIYSAQACNARCRFCVEELRPASRGATLALQRFVERDDFVYFSKLQTVLSEVHHLNLSVSVTGGEPSKDARLPGILKMIQHFDMRKRTLTTNASGLLDVRQGRTAAQWICATGLHHLNISRAHRESGENSRLMRLPEGLTDSMLSTVTLMMKSAGVRVRFSCVLLAEGVNCLELIVEYIEFARSMSVDNVIFRQLMKTDSRTHLQNDVVAYSDSQRVRLEHLLEELSFDDRFVFQKQIMGYYYYVEVWRYKDVDVVFEEADLAQLERDKLQYPDLVHELVFHPNASLCSTWQPRDGILGPDV